MSDSPNGGAGASDGLAQGSFAFDSPIAEGRTGAALGLPVRPWHTVAIILLTAVADLCLYADAGGSGLGALLAAVLVGLVAAAGGRARHANPWLAVCVVLAAAASVWQVWPSLVLVGWLALIAFAVKLHRPDWTVTEVGWATPWTLLLAPLKLLGHALYVLGYAGRARAGDAAPRRRFRLRVVLVPLCVVTLFVLIFIAANPVVERIADQISERLGEWLKELREVFKLERMFAWVLWLMLFAALIRPAAKSWLADFMAKRPEALAPPQAAVPGGGNYPTAAATLVSVNVLFLAFNALDAWYLYFRGTLPQGISYSTYSRQGCMWLTLALLLSAAVIGITFERRLNFHPRRRALTTLSYIWAAQNGVLAVGALRRLQMYIDYNGLTRLRIVGLYGVVLVVVGLALMVRKVHRAKTFTWLVRRDAVALWVAVVLLALTPSDWLAWRYNAGQALSGNLRPLTLLNWQPMSPESLPPLIPLLDYEDRDPGTQELVRRGVAELLGRELRHLRQSPPRSWASWEGSRAWARAELEAVSDRLRFPPDRRGWGTFEEALRGHVRQWE